MDLTPQQAAILQRVHNLGFEFVSFPIYPNYVGIRKGNCAALLAPVDPSSFRLFAAPSYIVDGNLSAKITLDGRDWYVWKKQRLEATPARLAELEAFTSELSDALTPVV